MRLPAHRQTQLSRAFRRLIALPVCCLLFGGSLYAQTDDWAGFGEEDDATEETRDAGETKEAEAPAAAEADDEPDDAGYDDAPPALKTVDTTPALHDVRRADGAVSVDFTIPYDGMVEFSIYDEGDLRIWHGQMIKRKGAHSTRIKTKSNVGGKYRLTLYYKGHTLEQPFSM